jgi:hypothetical protein
MAQVLDADFVSLEVYAIYTAITEVCGEDGWKIMWRSGELAFQQVQERLDFPSRDPVAVLRTLAQYLVRVGYLESFDLELRPGGVLEYEMVGAPLHASAARLIRERAILPHWSTAMMVAGLRALCGVDTHLEGHGGHHNEPELVGERRARERWLLTRDGVPIS